jgi:hypothetical protein
MICFPIYVPANIATEADFTNVNHRSRFMHSRCHCSDCRISSKLFPRNCQGRIILPLLNGEPEQVSHLNKDGSMSTATLSIPDMQGSRVLQGGSVKR